MNLEDIDISKQKARLFGVGYDDHIVFSYLDTIRSFYETLSWCNISGIETAAILSESKIFSTITYIYSSIEGTIESISVLLRNGRCNDAFALVRKYCDSIILDIYKHILVKEIENKFHLDLSIESIKDNRIKAWIDSEVALFNERETGKIYTKIAETHPELTKLFNLTYSDTLYHKLRDICNDNVHYNHLYNMMANDFEMIKSQKEMRDFYINSISKAIVLFFTIHFAFIYESNPTIYMSSDYIDHLDCGAEPPKGSERWISSIVQKAYDYIIKTNHPIVANYIKSLDLMELE